MIGTCSRGSITIMITLVDHCSWEERSYMDRDFRIKFFSGGFKIRLWILDSGERLRTINLFLLWVNGICNHVKRTLRQFHIYLQEKSLSYRVDLSLEWKMWAELDSNATTWMNFMVNMAKKNYIGVVKWFQEDVLHHCVKILQHPKPILPTE